MIRKQSPIILQDERDDSVTVTEAAGIRNLRSSLEVLEQGGRLQRIDGPVNLDCELGTVAFEVENRGIGAVLFNQPACDPAGPYHPEAAGISVVAGVLSHTEQVGLILGCATDEVVTRLASAMGRGVTRKPLVRVKYPPADPPITAILLASSLAKPAASWRTQAKASSTSRIISGSLVSGAKR